MFQMSFVQQVIVLICLATWHRRRLRIFPGTCGTKKTFWQQQLLLFVCTKLQRIGNHEHVILDNV